MHSDPIRAILFDAVNNYQTVDSGGSFRNTLGYRVGDKLEFIRDYKFTIAVENSSVPGYTTEKLLEPALAGSMPIYWGDPRVADDFNTDRFVWVRSSSPGDIVSAVEEISHLDRDPVAYAAKMEQPIFREENTLERWEDRMLDFFDHIFDLPHPTAFRRALYGFNRHQTLQKERTDRILQTQWARKLLGFMERLTRKHQKPTN